MIPREKIRDFEKTLDLPEPWKIAGSYRRGKKLCGDIDLIIGYDGSAQDLKKNLPRFENLYADGSSKIAGNIRLPSGVVQLDVYVVPKASFAFGLLYLTGSKTFNIGMRNLAKTNGFRLNQTGLVNLKTGESVFAKTEQDIFKILGIKYIPPNIRDDWPRR